MYHPGGVMPPRTVRPTVVTVHDLQPLDMPDNFSPLKRNYHRLYLGLSSRGATRVTVPSQFTADRLEDRLRVKPDKIGIVPWSIDLRSVPDPATARQLVESLGLSERYILLPAITYPHKNHSVVVDAFDQLASDDPALQLVLTGGVGPAESEVLARIDAAEHSDRILRAGRVPRSTLDALYLRASAVVFPSQYEGFGLPVLEAMAHGCPIVVSSAPAIDEIAPAAAPRVEPDDTGGWARAIGEVISQSETRTLLSAAGIADARRYDPTRTARGLIEQWQLALS